MSFDWSTLRDACVTELAREIARPRSRSHDDWVTLTQTKAIRKEAKMQLRGLTNLELLDLIARVAGNAS